MEIKENYIHGKNPIKKESHRLKIQAKEFKPYIWENVDLNIFNLDESKPFLELGCGVGAQTKDLLEKLSKKISIIGIDSDNIQLKVAKKEIKDPRCSFYEMDGTDLKYPDNFFCGAYISWVLEHMTCDDAIQCLKELRRTISNDGIIMINSSYLQSENGFTIKNKASEFPESCKFFLNLLVEWQKKKNKTYRLGERKNIFDLLIKSGFEEKDLSYTLKKIEFTTKEKISSWIPVIIELFKSTTFQIDGIDKSIFNKIEKELKDSTYQCWHFGQVMAKVKK